MCNPKNLYVFISLVQGLFLAFFSFQQVNINRRKLNLDLYNKRFAIYTDTLAFYQELMTNDVSSNTESKFINSKEASYHLFSKDKSIYALLDSMHDGSFKIKNLTPNMQALSGSADVQLEKYNNAIKEKENLMASMPQLKEKMSKYLKQ